MKTAHNLCDQIELVNSTLGNGMISNFIIRSLGIIFTSFFVLRAFLRSDLAVTTVSSASDVVLNSLIIMLVVHSASIATQAAKKTPTIVSKIILHFGPETVEKDLLSSFLLQYRYRNLNFETELFTINGRLFVAVSFDTNVDRDFLKLFIVTDLLYDYYILDHNFSN